MLFLVLLLLQSEPGLQEMNNKLEQFCQQKAECISEQKQAIRRLMGIWGAYSPPDAQVEACAEAATTEGGLTDWKKAESCLREWADGRSSPSNQQRQP